MHEQHQLNLKVKEKTEYMYCRVLSKRNERLRDSDKKPGVGVGVLLLQVVSCQYIPAISGNWDAACINGI